MKRIIRIFVILMALFLLSACSENMDTPSMSSTIPDITSSAPTKPSSAPTQPSSTSVSDCSKGHTFPMNVDNCTVCGVNYFSATLEFQLNDTGDGYIVSGIGSCNRPTITVPAVHNGLPVTEIGEGALASRKIQKVVLPYSVTKIGPYAFSDAIFLEEIWLSENLTYIGEGAFYYCKALKEIDIPAKVTYLGANVFEACTSLREVSLHDGITEIGESTFSSCSALRSIYIPKTITVIPQFFAAFCESLETVEIGGELICVEWGAFSGCKSLKTIDLGSKLETIGKGAFYYCFELSGVILPDTIREIGESAFEGCISLQKLSIPNGVEKISNRVTTSCSQLEYNIYEGMQYLGNEENPYMVLVGRADFAQKHLIVHEDTRFIPDNENFSGTDIESIYLGKSVEAVHGWSEKGNPRGKSFSDMDALVKIEVSSENKRYHSAGNCLIETETKKLVQGCKNSVIPADGSVEIIKSRAFWGLDGLTSLVIPDAVKKIDFNAFGDCVNLQWLVIGSGVTDIGIDIVFHNETVRILYKGTRQDWGEITISALNSFLKNAPRYYYSEEKPTEPGNYWRYVDGVPTPWETDEA